MRLWRRYIDQFGDVDAAMCNHKITSHQIVRFISPYTHAVTHPLPAAPLNCSTSCSAFAVGWPDVSCGVTVSVSVCPLSTPENVAGGAGLMLIGPTSTRYVPSTSNVPSARTAGTGNRP